MDRSGIKATRTAIPISSAAFVSSSLLAHSGQSGPSHGSCGCTGIGVCVSSIFFYPVKFPRSGIFIWGVFIPLSKGFLIITNLGELSKKTKKRAFHPHTNFSFNKTQNGHPDRKLRLVWGLTRFFTLYIHYTPSKGKSQGLVVPPVP